MNCDEIAHVADDGVALFLRRWPCGSEPRAVVQIVHGLAEHSARYDRLAERLNAAGFTVYAHDLRGHGHSAPPGDLGFFGEKDGWSRCVDDIVSLRRRIGAETKGAPLFLLGHSMGSFLAQDLIGRRNEELAGVALSGSNGPPPLAALGRLLARIEHARIGSRGRSAFLNHLMFGSFNGKFKPTRTPFDWLSRDSQEVDAYLSDPYCGFVPTNQLVVDLLDALKALTSPERIAAIPKNLPVYIFSGARDPVGANLKGLIAAYRAAGVNVAERLYPEARHETLNETNRAQVIEDLLRWMEWVLVRRARASSHQMESFGD